ncbi:PepSY-associated TM helix domain-containing protein [Microseira sp. BLCC-F43]|uniref:PepSY-associated TM helix domain-containing protein n=1 Tax=Microseira sp. BLCC-F43 TaxID=3153602 RepID=UPI0035BB5DFA
MKLRYFSLFLHRYAGVMTGILLVIICLTGSVLVFSEEIERLLNPKLFYVTPQSQQISVQRVVDTAQKAYPELKPQRVLVPQKPNETYTVLMTSPQERFTDVFINPYNGKILGSRPWEQTLYGILLDLHVKLFAGDTGKTVVGIYGLSLLFLSITGIILWPGWRKVATGFQIRWKSPTILVHYDIHKVGGILSVVFLSLITFTGVAMIFSTQFESAVYSMVGTPPQLGEPTSKVVAGVPSMSVDGLLKKASLALPGTRTFKFYPTKNTQDPFVVWMIFPQEKNEFNKHLYVYLDQYTGKVLQIDDPRKATLATRILDAQYILHIGSYGGLPMRILYAFIGCVVVVLLITGLALWRRRLWLIARRVEAIRHRQKVSVQTDHF